MSVQYCLTHLKWLLVSARRNVVYPMLFKMTNQRVKRESHCGVLEFVAEEGKIYIPHWVSIDSITGNFLNDYRIAGYFFQGKNFTNHQEHLVINIFSKHFEGKIL